MSQAGFTPIQLYYSSTLSAVPTAGNLAAGELAINTNDGKLFYKDSAGVVQEIASKAGNINVRSISFGSTGLTPATSTTGAVTVAGTLAVANGGTGVTTSTGTGSVVRSTSPVLTTPDLGTPSAVTLTNATGLSLTTGVTGTLPVTSGGTGVATSTGTGSVVLSTSPALTTPNLGTPSGATLTNATGLPLTTGVTGTLAVANGGTGVTTSTGTGSVVLSSGAALSSPVLTTPNLGTPSAGTLTNATGLPLGTGTTGTLAVARGGTGVTASTGSGSVVLSTSPVLTTPDLGTPSAVTLTNGTGLPLGTGTTGTLAVARGGTGLATTPANGALDIGNGTGFTRATLTAGSGITINNTAGAIEIIANSGGGSVTSVGLALPSIFSVSGSPVTTAGTLTGALATQTANLVFAGPDTGAAAGPTFRSLVAADIPTLNQNTTGTAGNVTGTVAVANGGTGVTTVQAAMNAFAGAVTSGSYLRGNGTNVVMSTIQAADVPTLNQNTTGTAGNVTGTVAVANGGTGQTTYTNGQLLIGNSTGSTLTKTTLTQGTGVTITNGAGSITISATGSGGTVTSVGLALPSIFTISGSPVTGSGTLTGALATQTANLVFAGPATGVAAAPTFRTLVAGDIPTLNQNTSGSAGSVASAVTFNSAGTGGASGTTFNGSTAVTVSYNTVGAPSTTGTNASGTWGISVSGTAAGLSSALAATGGGTGNTSYAVGDLLYASTTTALSRLADVATGSVLLSGGVDTAPAWGKVNLASAITGTLPLANGGTGATTAAAARTAFGATTVGANLFTLANVAAIAFPRINADNTVSTLDAATFRTAIGAGTSSTTGTVTSVGGTGTVSGLSLSGTVTTTGNLTLGGTLAVTAANFASQTANTFLAAPNGAAGVPTFRALVAADIPTLNQNTTGTAAGLSATLALASGGTGQTTALAAFNALSPSTTLGDLIYNDGTNDVRLAGNTVAGKRFLAQTGTGAVSAAPAWAAIVAGDIPTLNQNTTGTAANVTGTVAIANGGTGATTAAAARTALGATTVGANLLTLANPGAITFTQINADNTVSTLDAASFRTAIGAGSASSVTSVGGTGTVSGITLSGTVTTSGNLTLGGTLAVTASNFASQTANTVLVAPNGVAGVPTFRGLVAADIPTLNQSTTGTAAGLSATLALASGGTGQTTKAAAFDALSPTTTLGDLSYHNGTDNVRLAGNIGVSKRYLTQTGTGTVSAAPVWVTLTAGDIPTLNQDTTGTAANVTGIVAVANGGTGITSLGTGVATWLGTPSSANLAAAVTGETGSGALVFGTSPTLTTPTIDGATFTGNAQTTPAAVTFSATAMAVNCSLSNVFTTTFTANVTTAPTFSNLKDGQTINWFITQDATGTRTMLWPTSFKWPGGVAGVLTTAANSVDLLVATYRSATGFWYATLAKGFA